MNTSDDNDIPDPLLEHMPLVPLPDGFTRRIMARLVLQAHFRLRFIDLAMPVFAILFLPVVMGVGWWVMTLIDPLWLAQARLELAFRWMVLPDATRVLLLLSASISLVRVGYDRRGDAGLDGVQRQGRQGEIISRLYTGDAAAVGRGNQANIPVSARES